MGTEEAEQILAALRVDAVSREQPDGPPPIHSRDPDDDYLIALAVVSGAALISSDGGLLELSGELPPVFSPAQFAARLDPGASCE